MTTEEQPLMTFPCKFRLKVMGEDIDNYADYVLATAQKHVQDVRYEHMTLRPSRNGKYIAVTIELVATSREQLDLLYIELNANPRTKMAL